MSVARGLEGTIKSSPFKGEGTSIVNLILFKNNFSKKSNEHQRLDLKRTSTVFGR